VKRVWVKGQEGRGRQVHIRKVAGRGAWVPTGVRSSLKKLSNKEVEMVRKWVNEREREERKGNNNIERGYNAIRDRRREKEEAGMVERIDKKQVRSVRLGGQEE